MANPRILAIEDDPVAAEALKLSIESLNYVLIDVVDEAEEFLRLVKATLPDVLLLDIDLGNEPNGIELAQQATNQFDIPFLYITSQHDSGTVDEAIASAPAAYITKPFDTTSLHAAIELAIAQKEAPPLNSRQSNSLFIREEGSFSKVPTDQLLFIEAQNKQCRLQLEDKERTITAKITELSQQLPGKDFIQVHRSFIVNLEKVTEIDGQYKWLRTGNFQVPIGRSYKEVLMTKLLKLG